MTGTLELLCGPSGVGKTSSLEGVVRSYRWTTRDPREDERDTKNDFDPTKDKSELLGIDGILYTIDQALRIRKKDGVFESKFGGSFVTKEKYDEAKLSGTLVGEHQYPDQHGAWYGFPTERMIRALERDEKISEQIDVCDPAIEILDFFRSRKYTVASRLFLSTINDIKARLLRRTTSKSIEERLDVERKRLNRNLDWKGKFIEPFTNLIELFAPSDPSEPEVKRRIKSAVREMKPFLEHRLEFDSVHFIFPRTLPSHTKQWREKLESLISELNADNLPEDLYDVPGSPLRARMVHINTRDEAVATAKKFYAEILNDPADNALVLTNFIYGFQNSYEFQKLLWLVSRSTSAPRTYINPIAVHLLYFQLGMRPEAIEEADDLYAEANDFMTSGQINRTYLGMSFIGMFTSLNMLNAQRPRFIDETQIDPDLASKVEKLTIDVYHAISDLNFYLVLHKAKQIPLNVKEIVSIGEFYLGLMKHMGEICAKYTGAKLNSQGFEERERHRWIELSDKFAPKVEELPDDSSVFVFPGGIQIDPVPLGKTPLSKRDVGAIRSYAEFLIMNYSSQIDHYARLLLKRFTEEAMTLKQTGISVKQTPTGIETTLHVTRQTRAELAQPIGDPILEYLRENEEVVTHPIVGMAIEKIRKLFKEMDVIYSRSSANLKRDGLNINHRSRMYPLINDPHRFMREHWIDYTEDKPANLRYLASRFFTDHLMKHETF